MSFFQRENFLPRGRRNLLISSAIDLFLIEGLITLCVGIFAFFYLPPSPTQTASRFRGKKGWFSDREETILVTRVLKDDPTKSSMHNRQASK